MKIDIDTYHEAISNLISDIVVNSLKESIEILETPQSIPFFSMDPKEEKKKVKKLLKAMKLVIAWHSVPTEGDGL
jgi:hypothetical protein